MLPDSLPCSSLDCLFSTTGIQLSSWGRHPPFSWGFPSRLLCGISCFLNLGSSFSVYSLVLGKHTLWQLPDKDTWEIQFLKHCLSKMSLVPLPIHNGCSVILKQEWFFLQVSKAVLFHLLAPGITVEKTDDILIWSFVAFFCTSFFLFTLSKTPIIQVLNHVDSSSNFLLFLFYIICSTIGESSSILSSNLLGSSKFLFCFWRSKAPFSSKVLFIYHSVTVSRLKYLFLSHWRYYWWVFLFKFPFFECLCFFSHAAFLMLICLGLDLSHLDFLTCKSWSYAHKKEYVSGAFQQWTSLEGRVDWLSCFTGEVIISICKTFFLGWSESPEDSSSLLP